MACNRISLAFINTDGLGWVSGHESRFVPNPSSKFALFLPTSLPFLACSQLLPPGSSFFLLIQEKGLQKEGCRSNAAEAGRSRSLALDDNQNLVPLREVSWLHRAWVERSKEEAALRPPRGYPRGRPFHVYRGYGPGYPDRPHDPERRDRLVQSA